MEELQSPLAHSSVHLVMMKEMLQLAFLKQHNDHGRYFLVTQNFGKKIHSGDSLKMPKPMVAITLIVAPGTSSTTQKPFLVLMDEASGVLPEDL